jgi:glyoxylase-like metal-dependent hydrolase (beta-lactamase superfamily II)
MIRRSIGLVLTLLLCSCSSARTTKETLQNAVTAMGGVAALKNIRTLTMRDGVGTRWRLGQTVRVADQETHAELTNVSEIADLLNGRASLDYRIRDGAFVQHRHEVLTKNGTTPVGLEMVETRPVAVTSPSGLFSWGTQNSPEVLLRRNVVTIVLDALESTSNSQTAASQGIFNGNLALAVNTTTRQDEPITLYFDQRSHVLAGFEVVDTETVLGDVPAQYVVDDYKTVSGVSLPHHIVIRKGGRDYSEVRFASIAMNEAQAESVFLIPTTASSLVEAAVAAGPDYSPVAIVKVANGLYFARGYSHNSMIVEFPESLALVEAPYTEAQSKTLLHQLRVQFQGKPVRYVAVTHHHYDHIGGVRAIAATGATVLVEKGHEPELRMTLKASHTHLPDDLETKRKAGQATGTLEIFEGRKTISGGGQSLELYAIAGSPHAEPIVLAFVPSAHALFQSDLWFPGAGSNGSAGPAAARQLLDAIRKLGLRVDTNVGGHGGVAPFAEFRDTVESASKATRQRN